MNRIQTEYDIITAAMDKSNNAHRYSHSDCSVNAQPSSNGFDQSSRSQISRIIDSIGKRQQGQHVHMEWCFEFNLNTEKYGDLKQVLQSRNWLEKLRCRISCSSASAISFVDMR